MYLITVVNNNDLYNTFIKNNMFLTNFEKICFDNNKENIFISKRYNTFLNSYDYNENSWFIFAHPDWEIREDLAKKIVTLDENKIYGPVGAKLEFFNNKVLNVRKGFCYELGRGNSDEETINGDINCTQDLADTLDCQCLIVNSSLIEKYNLRFDENLAFDLYAEDFCINAKLKYKVETNVIKIDCCHHSDAGFVEIPESYKKSLEYLKGKYSNDLFAGTCSFIGGKPYVEGGAKEIMFYNLRNNMRIGMQNA